MVIDNKIYTKNAKSTKNLSLCGLCAFEQKYIFIQTFSGYLSLHLYER